MKRSLKEYVAEGHRKSVQSYNDPTIEQAKKLLSKFDKATIINLVYDSDKFQNGFQWHFDGSTEEEILDLIEKHIKEQFK